MTPANSSPLFCENIEFSIYMIFWKATMFRLKAKTPPILFEFIINLQLSMCEFIPAINRAPPTPMLF